MAPSVTAQHPTDGTGTAVSGGYTRMGLWMEYSLHFLHTSYQQDLQGFSHLGPRPAGPVQVKHTCVHWNFLSSWFTRAAVRSLLE